MKVRCSVYILKQRKTVSSTEFNNMQLILSFLFTGFLYKKRVLKKKCCIVCPIYIKLQ